MENTVQKRNYALDIIRIVAVCAVIMIHCSASFVSNYPIFSAEFTIGNILDTFSRIGVPLFLMISGALFLDENKQIPLKTILFKNVKNIAIITLIWATIYSLMLRIVLPFFTDKAIQTKDIFSDIMNGHYHMWYLYMIIGIYLITPFLKKFVCKENRKLVLLYIIIALCTQFFTPIIDILSKFGYDLTVIPSWLIKFQLGFFGGCTTYFITGWYIVHVGIKRRGARFILYLLSALSAATILLYVHFTRDYVTAYTNINILIYTYSVGVFLALNQIKWNLKEKAGKMVAAVSKLTFGSYLVHVLFLTIFNELFPYTKNCALYLAVSYVAVTGASFLFSFLISQIPVLKKIIKT